MHPGKHLVGLAYLDEFVSFGHGIGYIVERRPRNWVNHLVNGHRALVLDLCHAVHFHLLIPRWGPVAGVRGCVLRRLGGQALNGRLLGGGAAGEAGEEGELGEAGEGGGPV